MIFLFCTPLCLLAHFFDTKNQGWHFYHDHHQGSTQPPKTEEEPKTLKALKEKVQALLEEAVFHPTPQNILRYQRIQKQIMDKSELFANIWAEMLIQEPELDSSIDAPTSYYGNMARKTEQQQQHEQAMKHLSQTHGLILMIDSKLTSQKLRTVVEEFAAHRKIPFVVINVDQNQRAASQMAGEFGVKRLPAVILQHRTNRSTRIIGYGLLAADTLEERMRTSL